MVPMLDGFEVHYVVYKEIPAGSELLGQLHSLPINHVAGSQLSDKRRWLNFSGGESCQSGIFFSSFTCRHEDA